MSADTPPSAPQGPEALSTTSCRAAPRLPLITAAEVSAARGALLNALREDDWELFYKERDVRLALRFLIMRVTREDEAVQLHVLEHVAAILGIDLPPAAVGGEGTR